LSCDHIAFAQSIFLRGRAHAPCLGAGRGSPCRGVNSTTRKCRGLVSISDPDRLLPLTRIVRRNGLVSLAGTIRRAGAPRAVLLGAVGEDDSFADNPGSGSNSTLPLWRRSVPGVECAIRALERAGLSDRPQFLPVGPLRFRSKRQRRYVSLATAPTENERTLPAVIPRLIRCLDTMLG